ncbi:MAG: protein kinase [Myxococcales bacterium]|nr:protein kinase [Myxococcales bacterium]
MPRVGDVVAGRYRLCAIIGQGGMGTVFEAVDTRAKRSVALKVLRPREASEERALRRFVREGRLASGLEHHNVVRVLDLGQGDDGTVFIVQELLHGCTLRALLAAPIPLAASLAIAVAVCDALVYAHERGLVHRDVKPDNIFLARHEASQEITPKLIDFGIARALEPSRDEPSVTESGVALGTAQYMAPEQARSSNDADARSDLWSVGAVLFELCAGRPPFVGPNFNTVVAQLLTQRPPRVDAVAPSIDEAIAEAIARALEPEPSARVQSAAALRDALIDSARQAGVALSLEALVDRVSFETSRERIDDHDAIDGHVDHRMTESFDPSQEALLQQTPTRITEEIAPVSTVHNAAPSKSATRRARDASLLVAALLAVVAGVAVPLVRRTRIAAPAASSRTIPPAVATARATPASSVGTASPPRTVVANTATPTAPAPSVATPSPTREPSRSASRAQRPTGRVPTNSRAPVASTTVSSSPPAPRANNGAPLLPAE